MRLDMMGQKTAAIRPVPVIKYCVPHCDGRFPCIRICSVCPHDNEPYSPYIVRGSKLVNQQVKQFCDEPLNDNVTKTLFGKTDGN